MEKQSAELNSKADVLIKLRRKGSWVSGGGGSVRILESSSTSCKLGTHVKNCSRIISYRIENASIGVVPNGDNRRNHILR
jgi:hypothetical protein